MPDLTLRSLTISSLGHIRRAHHTVPTPTPPEQQTDWLIQSVNPADGSDEIVYATAKVGPITEGICSPEQATFTIPVEAADVDQLGLNVDREVQIYRNGHLVFWGKPTQRRANSRDNVWVYTAQGSLWYLAHRNFGEANRRNYLKNGSFDTDLSNWTTVGGDVTPSHDTLLRILGPGSLKLITTVSGENYKTQLVPITTGSQGLALFVTAWFYITEFDDVANNGRGIVFFPVNGGVGAGYTFSIDSNTPRNSWQRVTGVFNLAPFVSDVIDVRLYGIVGEINYDAVTVTVKESLSLINFNSPGGAGWEQEEIALYVCRYLGGRFPLGVPYTKSNVHIGTAKGTPSSGLTKERTYQFYDHAGGYQGGSGSGALDEWPQASDGFDYRVDVTPTTKTFRTYWPNLGVDRSALGPFVFRRTLNETTKQYEGETFGIVAYDMGESIDGSATDVTVMGGWGTGSGREEGGASIPAALGGPTLELVEAAPTNAPIDLLQTVAQRRATQLARVLRTPVLVLAEPRDPVTDEVTTALTGIVRPGDLISVRIDNFSVQVRDGDSGDVPAVARVTVVTMNPDDDTLTVAITL